MQQVCGLVDMCQELSRLFDVACARFSVSIEQDMHNGDVHKAATQATSSGFFGHVCQPITQTFSPSALQNSILSGYQ